MSLESTDQNTGQGGGVAENGDDESPTEQELEQPPIYRFSEAGMELVRGFQGGGWSNENVAAIVAAYARVHGCFRLPDFKDWLDQHCDAFTRYGPDRYPNNTSSPNETIRQAS